MKDEMDPLEQRLKRQPLRQVPADWREEILLAANEAARAQKPRPIAGGSFLSTLNARFASLFWPHPVAWAALIAVWIFIVGVHVSLKDRAPVMAEKTPPPSAAMLAQLHQQQEMYAELLGGSDLPTADRPKTFVPQPRSERVEFLTA